MKKLLSLGLISLSALVLVACSGGETTDESSSKSEEKTEVSATKKETTNEEKTYKVGDVITFNDGSELKITDAAFTDYINEFEDAQPEKVLEIKYNFANNGEDDYVLGSDIELYVDGKKMETYPVENVTFETVSSGRSFENAVAGFGVNGSGAMELEIKPLFSFDNEKYIIKLDLQ
ncbi:hypothetical protein [Streptococcus hyovaginalis]|uniref:hypothetical protein n=1 Tax=Streptococcus hyovaginalis TaxID=149015 RepID=UPI00147966F0|nr:hypothetical protein [Streptococcus hyovaginalis]